MRRYQFPLQTALDLRSREEEQARRRLARSQRVLRDRRSELRRIRARLDAIVSALRGERVGDATVALGEIEHTSRVVAEMRRRATHQQRRVREAEREAETRRVELIEASRARRTLERLSERREAEHRRAELLREQRELNEAAISRHRMDDLAQLALSRELDSNT